MKKLVASFACLVACSPVFAQNISIDVKDAPIKTTLEMMFKQAGIKNYIIENSVSGFVTMTLEGQDFENVLKIALGQTTEPHTYVKENNIWIIKRRIVTPTPQTGGPDPIPETILNTKSFERISLTFIDPADLLGSFGNILFISQFQRSKGGMQNGMGASGNGGFASSGGNGNSSMGGFGGLGMGGGNSMGGGAMGGFGGGAFGGMNGGVGGFGGGRNF